MAGITGTRPLRRPGVLVATALAALLLGCGGSTGGSTGNGPTGGQAGTDHATNGGSTDGGTATGPTSGGEGTGPGAGPTPGTTPTAGAGTTGTGSTGGGNASTDTRPVVGNIEMSASNVECSYVPNGGVDGSDALTVFAYMLLIGANALPGSVTTSVSMSNGYTTTYSGQPSNSASKAFQAPVRSGDWGRVLTLRIQADPDDRYRETNEADNTIEVTVRLPATRPVQGVDPLPCSARRVG